MIFRRSLLHSLLILTVAVVPAVVPGSAAQAQDGLSDRWSAQKANDWYAKQPWLVGANFIPSNAINQFEMFQATTFDPSLNDKELGMAESIGMNTVRVFLQDQLWQQDSRGRHALSPAGSRSYSRAYWSRRPPSVHRAARFGFVARFADV
jgi:hypothetical protein